MQSSQTQSRLEQTGSVCEITDQRGIRGEISARPCLLCIRKQICLVRKPKYCVYFDLKQVINTVSKMGMDLGRGGGTRAPFLVIGLLFICIVLVFNWWSLSTQNLELYRQLEERGEHLKIGYVNQPLPSSFILIPYESISVMLTYSGPPLSL